MAIDNSILPPIPEGFQLKDSSSGTANTSTLPPIPDGFQLKNSGEDLNKSAPDQWEDSANSRLSARPSALAEQAKDPATLDRFIKHPVGTTLRTLQGAGELMQGVPASIALDLQQGKPQNILPNLGKVVTGQRPAEYGDVLTGAGAPEGVSKVGGLAMDTALTPGGAEGVVDLAKGGINSIKSGAQAIGKKAGLFDLAKANQQLKNPEALAQSVRESVFNNKNQQGKIFSQKLDALSAKNPNVSVDLSDPIQRLKDAMSNSEENPGLSSQVKGIIKSIKDPQKAKMIQDIIDNPDKATNLTLKQSQDIKVAIQNAPAIANKLKMGKFAQYSPGDIEVLDLLDNVKLKQGENFSELADIRKPYADYMNDYNNVKSMFKPRVLLNNIKDGFGNNEEIGAMAKRVMPDATNKQIENIRKVIAMKQAGKTAAKWAGGAAAGGLGLEAVHAGAKELLGQ